MKKVVLFLIILLSAASLFSSNNENLSKSNNASLASSGKIEVYYFHFKRRCITCKAVEVESQKAIMSLYPNQYKSAKIIFRSVNLDDANSKVFADKCKIEGQALIIIGGNKRFDLTEKGFMYARNNPKKLKQEIKNIIDQLIE